MSKTSVRAAASALPWSHHAVALVVVVVAFGGAAAVGTDVAYYAAALVAFSAWMAWFVATVVDRLRRADA
ncbi:hypothetical protein [Halorarum salinum]|uniref:Uncharacterized protein n=1 Tax=Halorarum salinum TaxID=2743089 RepID=A0A7D5LB25_9EURY|nr:hypothetical protein [Halobaculum salinum]QLG62271.1 hypothetical protein HUG12_11235 [Halobaculum salinum]